MNKFCSENGNTEETETICLLYDKKLRDFNKADVAELVDARDLKSSRHH